MLHPATVHFAMVLPVVAVMCSLIYMVKRDERLSKLSSRITLVAALAVIGVWYTGSQAGPEIFKYLSAGGKEELLEHKSLGLYLAIAFGVIAFLKMLGCKLKKFSLEVLAIVLLLVATVAIFKQGKDGGELVYKYGTPFKSFVIEDNLKKAVKSADDVDEDSDKVEIYEDAIDEIDGHIEEINAFYGIKPAAEEDEE
jgi:uncharacterized membrane protein